jgi:dTDP-4-dehydrorhamnose reductase
MTHQHILITGGSGLLALNWACVMRQHCRVTLGVHHHEATLAGVESMQINLDSLTAFDQTVKLLKPDVIVHTAGLTQVDACELDPAGAHHANVTIAAVVAKIAAARSIRLVHISTDHLFDGLTSLSTEQAAPLPLNVYASTK